MTRLLTDDEMVALAARESTEFPLWLPTVARLPGEIMGAVLRGTRSLLVRGLAEETHDGPVIDPRVSGRVAPLLAEGWRRRCFAYATLASFPVAAGGARIFASGRADEWHLDQLSSFGIHNLLPTSEPEFDAHVRAFLDPDDSTYPADGGLESPTKAVAVYCEGLADELIVKTREGFLLAGTAGRDDLPLMIDESDFAFRRIEASEASDHLGVSARPHSGESAAAR